MSLLLRTTLRALAGTTLLLACTLNPQPLPPGDPDENPASPLPKGTTFDEAADAGVMADGAGGSFTDGAPAAPADGGDAAVDAPLTLGSDSGDASTAKD